MTDDAREIRESIRKTVRNVLGQYVYIKHALAGSSSCSLEQLLERLELQLGSNRSSRLDSDARLFVLTIDRIVTAIDAEMNVKGACEAAAWRLIHSRSWQFIADGLRRNQSRTKEIVDEATAKLFAEIVGRKITEDYRELPGLDELAA